MSNTQETHLTPFNDLLNRIKQQGENFTITLPDDWLQGRTAYGGLSAALCLEATRRAIPELPPIRSAQFSFVGPATGELRIHIQVLRRGKSTVFTSATLEGEMGLAVQASFCFGLSRSVENYHLIQPVPDVPEPASCPAFFTWNNRPDFMCHFEGALAAGETPCSQGHRPEMTVWLRHRFHRDEHTVVDLLALADALPPAFFVLIREPVPISTVTWSIDFLEDYPQDSDGWWLVQSTAESAANGFSTQVISIWTPDGKRIANARQNIAVFSHR